MTDVEFATAVRLWMTVMDVAVLILFALMFAYRVSWRSFRALTDLLRRSWFGPFLVFVFVCGMVHYAATKGTNGTDRAGHQTESRVLEADDPRRDVIGGLRDGDGGFSGEITNLCFTGISVASNGVSVNVAWPTNLFRSGTFLDVFVKVGALTNDWRWIDYGRTLPGETNASFFVDVLTDLGLTNRPDSVFVKVQDRGTCAATMADSDGDRLPDVYELHHGTNPYLDDFASVPKLTVGPDGAYATLDAALAASTNYSVLSLSAHTEVLAETVVMPPYPVMVTGPEGGYAVLRSSADVATVMLDAGQGRETLFRNLAVSLEARDGFQSAFWIGGNLPWSGVGSSPTFENVRVRALYPDVLHFGWHYYRDNGGVSSLSNCVMNAAGSTAAVGVSVYDGPELEISACAFVNFPTNAGSFATWIRSGTNLVTEATMVCANLSWAGCSPDAFSSGDIDSDGDGLSDYDEIHVYDTDPWLADSDGDGQSDADEIEVGTDPRDLYSFRRSVTVVTWATDDLPHVTNYVAWGWSEHLWETNGECACAVLPATNQYTVMSDNGSVYVKVFRDLNRNGVYDPDADVYLSKRVPSFDSVSCYTFVFGDVDGDGQTDSSELQNGTDPMDSSSYCFNLSFVETGIFSTTNRLTAEVRFGSSAVVGPVVMTSRVWSVDLGHLVASNSERVIAYFWDDANSNGVRDAGECYSSQTFPIVGHDNVQTNKLSTSAFDRDNDGMLDYWEMLHQDAGLSPTNAADAFVDYDSDGLINLHEYWAKCDPTVPDGSNTVLSIMTRSIDGRLSGNAVGTIDKFIVYNSILSTNCWAYTINTSCASANNSYGLSRRAGTAISPWHVAVASHYYIPNGSYIDFVTTNGFKVTRKIQDGKQVLSTDIYILLLEDALPEDIRPAKILPDDYIKYIRTGRGLPMLVFDYSEHAIVNEMDDLPAGKGSVDGRKPVSRRRLQYFEEVVSGDSGDPKFLVVNCEVILITTLTSYGRDNCGIGPSYQSYAPEIQNVMDTLSDRNLKQRVSLRYFDFDLYQALED